MISVNETGFLPEAPKIAVSDKPGTFHVFDDNERKMLDKTVSVEETGFDDTAGCDVYRLDFSWLKDPGIYHISSDDGDASATFKVEPNVYKTLKNALLKFFYFQRCGCSLTEEYAGIFSRNICHQKPVRLLEGDDLFHIPKGWHDAGDYGRYASAGSVAVAHMLYAYELFPDAFDETVNIPESGNGIPDILNECRYELEFLSEMQDEDGGVHHKVTGFVFCGFVMPDQDEEDPLLFPVTSLSTADFAAVMCLASRVYEKYDPSFARDCMHQAYLAGQWLIKHPENTGYHNPEGCNTGEYEDSSDIDERAWAFAELLRTDHSEKNSEDRSTASGASKTEARQDEYLKHFSVAIDQYLKDHPHSDGRSEDDGLGWQDVSTFAAIAVIFDPSNRAGEKLREKMTEMLFKRADAFLAMQKNGYPLSMKKQDFSWGSNMIVTNRADVLILAGLALSLGKDGNAAKESDTAASVLEYNAAALNQLHYILGMNAMEISYVTAFGEHAIRDPHNRVAISDGIEKPIPGELSGGPCSFLLDPEIKKVADENTPAQKCFLDNHLSYSTNEIAVYWNSSLLFATAFFDRLSLYERIRIS